MQRRHAPYTSREPLSLSPFFYSACSCVCTPWLGSSSGHACGRRSNRPRVFHSNYSAPSNYQIASDGVASKRDRGWIPSWSSFTPFASVQPSHRKTLFKIKNRVPLAERERERALPNFSSHTRSLKIQNDLSCLRFFLLDLDLELSSQNLFPRKKERRRRKKKLEIRSREEGWFDEPGTNYRGPWARDHAQGDSLTKPTAPGSEEKVGGRMARRKMTKGMNGGGWGGGGGSLSRGFGFWEIEANSQLPPLVECRGPCLLSPSTFPSSCPLSFALLATLMSLIWLKESAVRIF